MRDVQRLFITKKEADAQKAPYCLRRRWSPNRADGSRGRNAQPRSTGPLVMHQDLRIPIGVVPDHQHSRSVGILKSDIGKIFVG